jgi:hypothetical protein
MERRHMQSGRADEEVFFSIWCESRWLESAQWGIREHFLECAVFTLVELL